MFDSGFSELVVIFIVAMIVFGPERLPELARKVGHWVGKFRRYMDSMRTELEKEMHTDELRALLTKQENEINELRDMLHDTRQQMDHGMKNIEQELSQSGEVLTRSIHHPTEEDPPIENLPIPDPFSSTEEETSKEDQELGLATTQTPNDNNGDKDQGPDHPLQETIIQDETSNLNKREVSDDKMNPHDEPKRKSERTVRR